MSSVSDVSELHRSLSQLTLVDAKGAEKPLSIQSDVSSSPPLKPQHQQVVQAQLASAQRYETAQEQTSEASRQFMHVYGEAIVDYAFKKLVDAVSKSPELQLLLGFSLKDDEVPDVQTIIMRMQQLIEYTDPPEVAKIDANDEFAFIPRGLVDKQSKQKLAQFYSGLKKYCDAHGSDLSKEERISPVILEKLQKQFAEQITAYLNENASLSKQLKDHAMSTLTVVWMTVNIMSTLGILDTFSGPTWSLVQNLALRLFKR